MMILANNAPPDLEGALTFLKELRRGGPWVLTAIVPDGRTTTITASNAEQVRKFIGERNGKQNLYYSVNPLRSPMHTKAKKTDVAR